MGFRSGFRSGCGWVLEVGSGVGVVLEEGSGVCG